MIGASLLGAEISGVDSGGALTSGAAATVNGIANFVITYPNNPGAIMTGCGIGAIDTRTNPQGAARVYVVAQVTSQPEVAVISDDFCFSRIADGTLTPSPTDISAPGGFTVYFVDGGDAMAVPFVTISASVDSSGGANVILNASSYVTDESGYIYPVITSATGASGDKAKIIFTVAGEPGITATVNYTIP